jgi:periplasmic protein TonB
MFNNLLESKPKKEKRTGWTLGSTLMVGGLIAFSAFATANAAIEAEKPKEEKIEFVEVKKNEPPPPPEPAPPPPPDVVAAPPPPKGFQVLTAPVEIPDVIPDIDLTKKVTDEADFSGKGVAGGTSKGVEGGTAPPTDQAYFEFQVEKTVVAAPGSCKPQFPDMLRTAGVSGQVLAQFIVGMDGRIEKGSFKVLKSDNDQFTAAVRRSLDCQRFLPAETGGRKVRMVVQQPFDFSIGG